MTKVLEIQLSVDRHANARLLAYSFLQAFKPAEFAAPALEITQVLAHDANGRISTMSKFQVAATDGRAESVAAVRRSWFKVAKELEDADPTTARYLGRVGKALGSRGTRFTTRLRVLAECDSELEFWDKVDRWNGSPKAKARAEASLNKLHNEATARRFDAEFAATR